MTKNVTNISGRLWLLTALAVLLEFIFAMPNGITFINGIGMFILVYVVTLIASLPALLALSIINPLLKVLPIHWHKKLLLYFVTVFVITLCYGLLGAVFGLHILASQSLFNSNFINDVVVITALLFFANMVAVLLCITTIKQYYNQSLFNVNINIDEPNGNDEVTEQNATTSSQQNETFSTNIHTNTPQIMNTTNLLPTNNANKLLLKGIITGGLILLLLIPTFFIQSLVNEREARQKEVVTEVSSKWATQQTLAGPFITLPYTENTTDADGKIITTTNQLIVLAKNINVNGTILPEVRPRSIYKVLLYKSNLQISGTFKPEWPVNINVANIDFTKAKICFTLTDFKGIEEEITTTFNGEKLLLNPGLPVNDFGDVGLSAPINITQQQCIDGIAFTLPIKLKGSEKLHFTPLSANSTYSLNSSWASPSFDGNVLPSNRVVKDSGFTAQWSFNRANLPLALVLQHGQFKTTDIAFGVSLVQPADQYNKTTRSVKYAILLIGLTFGLFFIIELLQKKPLHPVQYVLVGLALVIFYSLLLSFSEYILFDYAYLIAATATVLLISLYAKSHFNSNKSALIFAAVLSGLYGFLFVLIRLEDTALLVGSIGLFMVLAAVMYASRKINWYNNTNS